MKLIQKFGVAAAAVAVALTLAGCTAASGPTAATATPTAAPIGVSTPSFLIAPKLPTGASAAKTTAYKKVVADLAKFKADEKAAEPKPVAPNVMQARMKAMAASNQKWASQVAAANLAVASASTTAARSGAQEKLAEVTKQATVARLAQLKGIAPATNPDTAKKILADEQTIRADEAKYGAIKK